MVKRKFKINLRNKQQRTVAIAIGISVILITLSIVLFSMLKKSYNDFEGNSPSNIINMGLAAYEDDNLYYTKFDAGYKIFKYDLKNESEKAVHTANAKFINVYKGYIYYINASNGNIMKVSVKGSEEKILYDSICSHLYVTQDWIYFIDNKMNNSICRINMQGYKETLLEDANAGSILVHNNYIYFIDNSDNNSIARLDIYTSEVISVLKQHTIFFTFLNDKIFYTNTNDESYIYSMNLDGTGKTRLEGAKGWFLSADSKDSNSLYFKAPNGTLRKINISTLNQVTISNKDCAYINILDNHIVYLNQDDETYYLLNMQTGKTRILR